MKESVDNTVKHLMENINRKMISTTNKHTHFHFTYSFSATHSNNFDLSKTILMSAVLHLCYMRNYFNTETSEEVRVQNDVIRLSIDLLVLCHNGSVTVNRHFSLLKIKSIACPAASTRAHTVALCC